MVKISKNFRRIKRKEKRIRPIPKPWLSLGRLIKVWKITSSSYSYEVIVTRQRNKIIIKLNFTKLKSVSTTYRFITIRAKQNLFILYRLFF